MEESVSTWSQSRTTVQRWVPCSGMCWPWSSYHQSGSSYHLRYAVTVRIRPGVVPGTEPAPSHAGMWDFMGTLPADLPKIVVVEDLTKPVIYGSMWGEVIEKERPHTCPGERHLLQGSRGGWVHHRRRSERSARDEKCWIPRNEQRGHNQSCLWSEFFWFRKSSSNICLKNPKRLPR